MKLYTPEEAGLVADYDAHDNYDSNPDGWVCHYPGVDRDYTGELHETFSALRGFEKYAMSKNWWGLAYDYWVDLAGHKGIGRGTARSGATSGDYDEDGIPNNNESDAILLVIGNEQEVTREMMDAVQDLVDHLGGRRDYFIGHRQAKGIITSCPGDSVMEKIVAPMSAGDDLKDVSSPGYTPKPAPKPHPVEPPTDWRQKIYDDASFLDLSRVSRSSSTWVRGDDVRVLQGLLVANGFAPANTIRPDGSLDGIAGPGTRAALVAAQRHHGLSVDAVAGRKTYGKLFRGLRVVDLSDVTRDYRTWVRGLHVSVVQTLLVANGDAPANTIDSKGMVDGVGGPGTRAALIDFQKEAKLTADGIVGPKTYRALAVK